MGNKGVRGVLRVLFIPITGMRGASSRYRVYQYLPFLERSGILPFVARIPSSQRLGKWTGLIRALKLASQVDVVFIQKRALDVRVLQLIRAVKNRLIYDFDDAVYASAPPFELDPRVLTKTRKNLTAVLHHSRLIIAGNAHLAAYAQQYNNNVAMIPTCIDTDKVRPRDEPPADELVIGWIGNSENLRYLQILEGLFARLASTYGSKLVLRVVSGKPYSSESLLNVDNRTWTLDTEMSDLRSFHIGLSPLADDEWTRGKCGFRALQYMATGIPTVVSPVGVNREIIDDGVNGFLAQTDEEWFARVSQLIEGEQLRRRLGLRGRSTVEREYSLAVALPKFVAALKEVTDL